MTEVTVKTLHTQYLHSPVSGSQGCFSLGTLHGVPLYVFGDRGNFPVWWTPRNEAPGLTQGPNMFL